MPNRSMTGFGLAESATPSGTFRVEIRSVNNRYQEMQIRLPKSIASLESKIKKRITEVVSRGSISVFIGSDKDNDGATVTWDKSAVENYLSIFGEIQKKYKLPGQISISDLISFNNILKNEQGTALEATLWKHFLPVLELTLESFQKSREAEAKIIVRDLAAKTKSITAALRKIELLAPNRVKAYAERLNKQIEILCTNTAVDPQRVAVEVTMMADRLDISEECTRLHAHIEQFTTTFKSDEPVGKRMNFFLQEMNREANTIGSKANDTQITHLAIEMKEQIEKIREQVQNLE